MHSSLGSTKPEVKRFLNLDVYASLNMDEHRKKRLRELIDRRYEGSQAALVRELSCSKTGVSNWLNPNQPFGEKAARGVADKLGLGDRYFEQGAEEGSAAPGLKPDEEVVLDVYRNAAPAVQEAIRIAAAALSARRPGTVAAAAQKKREDRERKAAAKKAAYATKSHKR